MEYHLEDVSGIGKATAERMKESGIDSVEKLASLNTKDLIKLKIKGIGKATAEKYINGAKILLKDVRKVKKEELLEKKEPPKKEKLESNRIPKAVTNIKELVKQQAECNIGLVGHVDHGMDQSYRLFP